MPALTTRRLATALGCQAMSVYHHFPSKQHLLDAVVEHAIAGIPEPAVTADPIDTIAFLAREYCTTAHRHPRLFQAIALYRLDLPAGVAFVERMLRHFHAAIPDDRLAAQAFRVFACYVTGAVRDETSGCAAGPSAAAPVSDEFIARECPRLAAAAPYLEAANGNAAFELGLAMVLKGLAELRASVLARSRPAPKPVIRLKA